MKHWFMLSAVISIMSWTQISMAQSAELFWPTRGTKVVCGGVVDGETLKMKTITNELLGAEASNGRVLFYADLHKPAQVHWIFNDALTDDDYNKREAAMTKLTPDEAKLLRGLTASSETEIFMGMTDGFVTYRTNSRGGKNFSMSCQESQIPGVPVGQ